jgi:hypothetical protein
LTVLNNLPKFTPDLSAITFDIMVNTTAQTLELTSYTPDLDGHVVTMTIGTLPTYTVYNSATKTFTFTPVATADIGTQKFDITLNDSC